MVDTASTISECKYARWAWRVSFIPIIGLFLFLMLSSCALIDMRKGKSGFRYISKGVIAVFIINLLPYWGLYLSGYSGYFPPVYYYGYWYLPKHGIFYSYQRESIALQQWHFGEANGKVIYWYSSVGGCLPPQEIDNIKYYWYVKPLYKCGEGYFKNGKANGKFISWHENGRISDEGECKEDNKSGKWCFYDRMGNLIMEEFYDDTGSGELKKRVEYRNNQPISITEFKDGQEVSSISPVVPVPPEK